MTGSYPTLRDRLEALGAIGRPLAGNAPPAPGTPRWDGVPFDLRRSVRSVHEIFGPGGPHDDDRCALFLDTETTGLAGGTGTIPFLIGLAAIEGDAVIVEQYFLRRLSGEPAMLEAVRDRLIETDALVTFNGRRFDWPILEARFIVSRIPIEQPTDHLDLMGPARRLWHRALGTYRLTAIEREALGIDRLDDVDSSQIPGLYLDYLRTGDAAAMEPVFSHNEQDVLCLLHLRRLVRRWTEEGVDPSPPVDWEGLGVLRLQAADAPGALDALRRALTVEDDPAVRWRIAQRLTRLLRRAGRWEELLVLWEHELGGRGVWRVRALIEASKTAASRAGQPQRALAALEEARGVLEWLLLTDGHFAAELDAEVRRRIDRLGRRRRQGREAACSNPIAGV